MDATIEIDGLRKRFAGKSTTMRVVLGLDAPDTGTATIGGRPRTGHDGPRQRRAQVAAAGSGRLTISNLSSERAVAALTGHAIPFTEVTAHRATLEEAYMELTRESVEFRAEATP